jgi:predicted RNA-binding protein with TRAM domain
VSYGGSYGGGSGRSFRGPPGPKPVEVGKEYEVEITEVSRQGDGIARVQGFVVFVKRGKVGQKAKVKIDQVGNRFAIASVVSYLVMCIGCYPISGTKIRETESKLFNKFV